MTSPRNAVPSVEPFGRRLADRRALTGLTQQRLADRIAMSRAALSHLEAGVSIASERTVTLLAGVFDMEPHELVDGTDYPAAKSDRLPLSVARYGRVDMMLALLDNDLGWCNRLGEGAPRQAVVNEWRRRLGDAAAHVADPGERTRLDEARRRLAVRAPG